MSNLKIGIVEDEMVISETICLILKKLGYSNLLTAYTYSEAIEMIKNQSLELLLLDINLGKGKDGIDLAVYVRENLSVPIIFLTANSDYSTIERAKKVKPESYLVKPFNKNDLFAAIEIAISNFLSNSKEVLKESFFVKDGYEYNKVSFNQILFIESDQNYAVLNLNSNKRIMVRSTLSEMLERLPDFHFLKINRSTIININEVISVKTDTVLIQNKEFSLTKPIRDELLAILNKSK